MEIKYVEKLEIKFLELLKLIDSGEYKIASLGNNFEGFERWIHQIVFTSDRNIGVMTAFILNDKVRIQISFRCDIETETINQIYEIIMKIKNDEQKILDIWVNNDNTNLVRDLMKKFNLERKYVYMSREMMYYKAPQLIDISPLKVIPYSASILEETLQLLEASFVNIAQPGEFINDVEYYKKRFSNDEKSRFAGFVLDNELVGMYYHKDGEIDYMGVKPEYQSKGYGKKILHHALKAIKEDSKKTPYLYCVDENPEALRFYLREGFDAVAHAARLYILMT